MMISIKLEIKEKVLLDFARLIGYSEDELAYIHEDECLKDELNNILEETLEGFCYC